MTRRNNAVRGLLAVAALALLGAGCSNNSGGENGGGGTTPSGGGATPNAAGGSAQLTGAGGTFPAPLYNNWFQEYGKAHGLTINYQPIGSGGGIKNITAKTVDFGASDAPMNDTEMKAAPGILHVPTVAGAVTVAYNVPGVPAHLHLTGPVIAGIFLGTIKTWNDPQIKQLNPSVNLPASPIIACHRSDGSGTTNIFTTYLSEVSPEWKSVGAGKSVNWPNGLGGKGNAGVAQLVQKSAGAVGYVELAYVLQNNITYADVQNKSGKFIAPSVASATAAVAGVTLPDDFRAVPVNTPAPDGYPITGFTFLLVYKTGTKPQVKDFLKWALTDGQKDAAGLFYAPLPDPVQKKALAAVSSIQ
ncbi:MAG: phosphate ABC transporter substrate-binding protein PstS [Armatimonadetes bacterium]|nr:phosphate ABC transporter substrate-binding protein PstS [Armatimonadota bacterium]